jgi:hypothetical protein
MVRKKNGKWWMCTDFMDLNKCCPKVDFPLARIDKTVDSAAASEMMALLDCFSGYHQIWLLAEDEEKTNFITLFRTYCYRRMSEGLRNTGATFCRMTKAALKDQVGRNILSYVDDIVVISKKEKLSLGLGGNLCKHERGQAQVESGKMCVWDYKGEASRMSGINEGNRSKPDKIRAIT